MKKLVAVLLCVLLMPVALAEEGIVVPSTGEVLYLPLGIWSLSGGNQWMFITQTDATLTPEQMEAAEREGIETVDGVLPSGSSLTTAQLDALYPGAEEHFNLPSVKPELEMFSLTGEWFYDENGILMYRHSEGYAEMTVDEVFAQLNGGQTASADEKIIYLTIDDTPSEYTMEMLATLNRLGVKATFFVVGASVRKHPVFLRAIYEQGHVIANHSFSHDGVHLASSFENCLGDFRLCEQAVAEALGFSLSMPILRVPYGSSTIPTAYQTQLQERGYMWIDWNALNGDTEPDISSDQDVLNRAITTAARYDGSVVMLVHDGKKRTIRTMEDMVKHFHSQGYEFRVLDTKIEKIPGVRMGLPK